MLPEATPRCSRALRNRPRFTRLGRSGVATAKTWSVTSRAATTRSLSPSWVSTTTHAPAGPQDVEDPGDVARRDGVGLGREAGGGQDLEPVRMGEQVLVEDLVEVVALGLGGQGVGDRELGRSRRAVETSPNWRSRSRSTTGWSVCAGQELGGVGGEERLAASARRRRDHDDRGPGRSGRPVRRHPEAARVMRAARLQRAAQLVIVGVERDEVVGPDLDDLGQVGAGPLLEGEDEADPGIALGGASRGGAARPGA